jgi:hypothetical protein
MLAGRPVPSAESGLVAFTEAVRASATAPGQPSAALAELLVTGLLTDQSSPSTATARSAGRDARRAPARGRRRRLRMLAPALFAKIASAGLAAKAATVAGVAVVGFSTAGFVGALPTPAQHTFATVVDDATPFTAPDPATASATTDPTDTTTAPTDDPTPATEDPSAPAAPTTTTDAPATPTPFGQQVSQMAHENKANGHPGVDGQTVSSMAHQRHASATDESGDDSGQQSGDDTTTGGDDGADSGSGQRDGGGHGHH